MTEPDTTLTEQILNAVSATTTVEWIAVLSGIVYIVLAALRQPLCWPAGIISSALYIGINFKIGLNLDAVLQVYYCIIGVYGWWLWVKKKNDKDAGDTIERMPKKYWPVLALICLPLALLLGFAQQKYTSSPAPFADAGLTVISFAATWMTARKYLENWLIWIGADLCYIVLYAQRGYPLTSILFLIYTFTALAGYISWRKQIKR
ncbi:MAG: nicotinamide riboside transporter PnuC [Bacteroidia bacterium]